MLSNQEIEKIIADIESGAYDVADVLEAIASAAKGEDVRAALYASVYATKAAQINGQPKIVTEAANMKNPDVKYLYLGEEEGYDYGYVYAYIEDEWVKTNLYGEGYSPSVSVTQIPTGVRVSVTDGHGTTTADVENGTATDAQVETYVENWLDEHPEATTTVEDASITMAKLAADVLYAISAGGGGLTADVKVALLDCFLHVAWIDEHGQDYYDALESALYPPADLVSISASFDSGGATIYNTDTLNDLKQYLTVTALYDDLSTEEIENYVLTGSMAAGTQTITVTYAGKTTNFSVTIDEWVTAISVVYTQSGTVYDTASLNDLKADLVVTASYADHTSDIVSDFTLSGTLEVGTSTITVSYVGKTDTFNVTVTHFVPIDYTLDALENVTWYDNYKYNNNNGTMTASNGEHCTSKFTVQDTIYVITDTSNACEYFSYYIWDDQDNYLGFTEFDSKKGTSVQIQLKPEYKYAIKAYKASNFDSSNISMLPVDKREVSKYNKFSIKLADYTDKITQNGKKGELYATDIFDSLGIAYNTFISRTAKSSCITLLGDVSPNFNVFCIGYLVWNSKPLLRIANNSVSSFSDLITYIENNDVTIVFNGD